MDHVTNFKSALESEASAFNVQLSDDALDRLSQYFKLVNKWNLLLHLVAPCSPETFATRHVLESLTLLGHLPTDAQVADIGSGAGLPIVPCLIVRPDIRATMIEAAKKKAVFLREVLRETGTSPQGAVLSERFETTPTPPVDFVTCRAIDDFQKLLPQIVQWSPRPSKLLFFGGEGLQTRMAELKLSYSSELLPKSDQRFLFEVSVK